MSHKKTCYFCALRSISLGRALVCLVLILECLCLIDAFPSASINSLSSGNSNIDGGSNDLINQPSDNLAERGFRKFIEAASSPDSTVIGEFKPNASGLELDLLRNKIASAIASIQEMNKNDKVKSKSEQSDCYIDVTRVEKIAGKCHKASNGLPICQSDNYMIITNECS